MWVWVSLPHLDQGARIEAFEPRAKSDDDDDDDDALWRKLCVEPCGMWIPSGTRLRVNGDFRVSSAFSVPAQPRLHLRVTPASSGARVGGIVLISVFSPFVVLGSLLTLATADSRSDDATTASRAIFVVGLAGLGTGLVLLISNRATKVQFAAPTGATGPRRFWAPALRSAFVSPRVELGQGLSLSPEGLHF
jgi:hypothetical protein